MPTLSTAARNAMANGLVDLIDAGTTDANGDLVIRTSADAEVATLAFSNPAFGDASAGVASANAIADDENATGGTAVNFIFRNRDNVEVLEGTVGTSGAELNPPTLTIPAAVAVSVSAFDVTQPAS